MNINFMGLMFLLFLGLKLAGIIAWSWVWVTAPLWIGLACVALIGAVGVSFLVVKSMCEK